MVNGGQRQKSGPELWKCRDCGKRGKPKAGFPLFPRAPWKSRQKPARFPHFHSSDDHALSQKPKTMAAGYRPPPARRFAPPQE